MRTFLPLAAALPLALAACAGQGPSQTAGPAPAATPFTQALAGEYKLFADAERADYDWSDNAAFNDKAKMAAAGQVPPPEDPAKRGVGTGFQLHPEVDIGMEQRAEAIAARQQLLSALQGGGTSRNPAAAARAQVSYDCWVEQLEEGWQRNDIERCRQGFRTAMAQLEQRPIAQAAPDRYQVYFAFDSTDLTPASRQAIAQAANDIRRAGIQRVEVEGHADRAGSEGYNRELSDARAKVVREELAAAGIPADRITTRAYGESDLQVPTADGVPQPENRRTVIGFD